MTTIERRVEAYIESVLSGHPGEGSGLHSWLYSAAASLWFAHRDAAGLEAAIYGAIAGSLSKERRRAIGREIAEAVRNARTVAKPPDWYAEACGCGEVLASPGAEVAPPDPGPRWPRKDYRRIYEIATERTYPIAEVAKHSPVPITDRRMTETVIDSFFPGDPLLCVAQAANKHHTAPREKWRGKLDGLPFVVPNVMTAQWGDKETGGRSMRCLGNVGPRRYLVAEFDFSRTDRNGKPTFDFDLLRRLGARNISIDDLCASAICELQFSKPILRLIVSSGGKSLHSWWDCKGLTDPEIEEFFAGACKLGADPATWTRCQLVRIPDGTRDNGTRQQVHLFNP